MIFRFLSFLMVGFFVMSVVVQFNDPDGPLWMLSYGAILTATVLVTFKGDIKIRWFLILLLFIYGFGVVLWSESFENTSLDAFMAVGMKNDVEERVRELWGLVICFIWAIALTVHDWRHIKELGEIE